MLSSRTIGSSSSTMSSVRAFALALCLVLLVTTSMVEARIDKVKLSHDDRSMILIAEPFGFNENGVIEMELGKATVFLPEGSGAIDKTRIGVILITDSDV